MSKIIWNGLALIRGALFSGFSKLFLSAKIQCGIGVARYKSVEISCDKGSLLIFSKNARIASYSVISATYGGRIEIGEGAGIGQYNIIKSQNEIKIGRNTIIGPSVFIYDHDHVFSAEEGVSKRQFTTAPITIGDNCWIGANVVILKGTQLGNRCVVGAGCVLKGSYPDDSLIIQRRETEVRVINRKA